MMNTEKKVIPYRIKQARVSRGLSMTELSELVSVSKQAISQYEMGKTAPSKAILNIIADVLKYPTSFFYKPVLVTENASSAVFFRSRKTANVKALNAAKEKMEMFREINDYLEQYIDFPMLNLPKITYEDDGIDPIDNEQIERYAMILREYWELGNRPIDNLINIVQKNGIMISKMKLRLNKLDAFSVWFDNKPFIFLNSDKNTNVRIRFDIAHELGHLLMHADYYTEEDLKNLAIHEKLENEANRFAGAFLLPKEPFSNDVFSTSIDHFIQMKAKWKASINCMIYRCDTLGILSPNQIKYLKDQMTTRVYWKKEPLDNEMPIEKPFAHKQAILLLLDNKIVTPNQLVEEIGCSAEELEQYCFLEKGTLLSKNDSKIILLKARK
ncbi:MAG: ImmA/IrrE family metallo-endopeptidase [Lachnospira sp.]|nr:ImmA/IrrE family metallo-endopeptidase [Lachnospira sp.]